VVETVEILEGEVIDSPSGITWEEYRDFPGDQRVFKATVSDLWFARAGRTDLQMLQAAVETFKMLADRG
jgi:hypothetical protein